MLTKSQKTVEQTEMVSSVANPDGRCWRREQRSFTATCANLKVYRSFNYNVQRRQDRLTSLVITTSLCVRLWSTLQQQQQIWSLSPSAALVE